MAATVMMDGEAGEMEGTHGHVVWKRVMRVPANMASILASKLAGELQYQRLEQDPGDLMKVRRSCGLPIMDLELLVDL